jgi:hypothetical protein
MCEYTSSVVAIRLCPRISMTTRVDALGEEQARGGVAQIVKALGGMPAFASSAL